jgi:hypothetical protein
MQEKRWQLLTISRQWILSWCAAQPARPTPETEMTTMTTQTTQTVTLDTRDSLLALSFYSLCRLADITMYADPIAAIPSKREVWTATLDSLGNLLSAKQGA